VGLSAKIDPTRAIAGAIPGIDVWEGKLALAAAAVVLIGMLALRLTRSAATRRHRPRRDAAYSLELRQIRALGADPLGGGT
jgi:hypothetical protein